MRSESRPFARWKWGGYTSCPDLMKEEELILFLRIHEISEAEDYGNVVADLKRMRWLPCIHISRQPPYPRDAICRWVEENLSIEMNSERQ